jgi:hypothetical protein
LGARESIATATAGTSPVMTKRYDEFRLSSVSPLAMDSMTRTPSSAEKALPRPPNRLVPPMTAAAMACEVDRADVDPRAPGSLDVAAHREQRAAPAGPCDRVVQQHECQEEHDHPADAAVLVEVPGGRL